jgi:hypothetical protein
MESLAPHLILPPLVAKLPADAASTLSSVLGISRSLLSPRLCRHCLRNLEIISIKMNNSPL